MKNKAVYVVIGINLEGKKEVLGLWVDQTEGAKFWLSVMMEIKNRGVEKIYSAPTVEAGEMALEAFTQKHDARYPTISKSWRKKWTMPIRNWGLAMNQFAIRFEENRIDRIE